MERVVVWLAAALWLGAAGALLVRRLRNRPAAPPDEWRPRPVLGALVHAVAVLVPIATAVACSALLSRQMPEPRSLGERVLSFGVLIVASTAVLVLVDRIARRLLPLAALLRLSVVFPDTAPERVKVARRAGSTRDLERRLREAREDGLGDTPTEAAERILGLAGALSAHDRRTRGHSERVRLFTDMIATELKLPKDDVDRLRWAALLHDIGKLEVPKSILNKPGKPTPAEWAALHRHPEIGFRMTAGLHEWLGEWAATIEQHHERFDGTGYPKGLAGAEISIGARIVAVADAYEVMTTARSYKKPMSATAARAELTRHAGSQFDPVVVRAFLTVSIGRQRWVTGPVTWIAQLPFIGWVPRLAESAAAAAGPVAGYAGAAAGAAALSAGVSAGFGEGELPQVPEPAPAVVVADADPGSAPAEQAPTVLGETFTRDARSPAPAPPPPPPPPPPADLPGNAENANGSPSPKVEEPGNGTSDTGPDREPAPAASAPDTSRNGGAIDFDPLTPGVQPSPELDRGPNR